MNDLIYVSEDCSGEYEEAISTIDNRTAVLSVGQTFSFLCSYGTGDFVLGKLLEALSGGKWDFVWAQQWFTMTDQLNMGVRRLMLDPVYFWGAMRLCHCGATFKWFDDVLHFIEKVGERDSHLGRRGSSRLFSWGDPAQPESDF